MFLFTLQNHSGIVSTFGKKKLYYNKNYFKERKYIVVHFAIISCSIDFKKKKIPQNGFLHTYFILGCGLEENTCVVSLDSEYLGSGNVDQFDAVVFRIRHFSYNAASIFFNI